MVFPRITDQDLRSSTLESCLDGIVLPLRTVVGPCGSNYKSLTLSRLALSRNTPAMKLDVFFADGEAHADSFVFARTAETTVAGNQAPVPHIALHPLLQGRRS